MQVNKDLLAQKVLLEKIGVWKCPICGNKHYRMLEGFSSQRFTSFKSNGRPITIPVISIGCENCGFISQHALGALGLLSLAANKEESKDE